MIFIWNRKEIYNGFSINKLNRIKDSLSQKGIKYDVKVVNRTTSSGFDTSRGRIGSMGENHKNSYKCYIYVHKKDYNAACYIINKSNK